MSSATFGILIGQTHSWENMVRHSRSVESAGFNSVWVADHFANPFMETDWLEAWTTLAGLATATKTIRIGTLVSNIVYRHPALLAKQAITVDHISGGRLDLGIGAGGAPTCHSMTGTPMWSGNERQQRLAEFIEMVDQLLRLERSSFQGEHYSAEEVLMRPRPVQQPRPPLIIAAHGPRSMKVAARYADTWSFFEPGLGLRGEDAAAAIQQMNAYMDEQAHAAGRDPASITRSYCCGYSASSTWGSLDEASASIELFEKAGVNDFILNYTPDPEALERAKTESPRDAIEVNQLIQDETELQKFARELLSQVQAS